MLTVVYKCVIFLFVFAFWGRVSLCPGTSSVEQAGLNESEMIFSGFFDFGRQGFSV